MAGPDLFHLLRFMFSFSSFIEVGNYIDDINRNKFTLLTGLQIG